MNIQSIDCSGQMWSSAFVQQCKSQIEKPMTAICTPYLYNDLAVSGFGRRAYETHGKVIDDAYQEGDLIWRTFLGIPDHVLILSNLDTVCVFHSFDSPLLTNEMYEKAVTATRQKRAANSATLNCEST